MVDIKTVIWNLRVSVQRAKEMGKYWTDGVLRKLGFPEEEIQAYHSERNKKLKKKMQKRRELLERIEKAKKMR